MGCNTSKATRASYSSVDSKKRRDNRARPVWHNREWDSMTDSQVNTTSTYLDRTGASTCSLRRDGADEDRGMGDGQEDPDVKERTV